jgi:hypothetical protein
MQTSEFDIGRWAFSDLATEGGTACDAHHPRQLRSIDLPF